MFYLGLDYSKRFSVATVIDSRGKVVKKGRLANRRESYELFLKDIKSMKAVVEAGRNWHVAVDLLEGLVKETKLAHPLKVRAIAEAKIKTDEIDSETLAQLLRANLIPEAYLRSKELREKQMILRLRSFWIRQRVQLRNRIHTLIDAQSERIRDEAERFSDLFGNRGLHWLGELSLDQVNKRALEDLLEMEGEVTKKIKQSNEEVKQLYEDDEDCKRIDGIPGFGMFLSTLTKVEIGEIGRFKSASNLASYAGVIPSTYSSGEKTRHGKIIKQGNKFLRWALVEAALHCGKESAGLKKFYFRIKRKKGTKIARVATARKLCGILFRLLTQKDYYRNYYQQKKQSRLRSAPSVPS
jgi:transposase